MTELRHRIELKTTGGDYRRYPVIISGTSLVSAHQIERSVRTPQSSFSPYVPKRMYPLRTVNVPVRRRSARHQGSRTTGAVKSVNPADAVPAAMRRANMCKL